jgi:hypothetical protein
MELDTMHWMLFRDIGYLLVDEPNNVDELVNNNDET